MKSGRRARINLKRTLGPAVAAFIEANLPHGPGDVQGEPFVLDGEALRFIFEAYAIDDQGRRLVKDAVYSRMKGRSKSELGGAIACAEGLGPVRFGGWDRRGYPIAVPITYPFVRILSTEEKQSGNVYDNVNVMLTEGPLRELDGLDVGLTRTFLPEPRGGEIVPSTAGAASKDGGKESCAIFDETHLYVSPELHEMHDVVVRNLLKRMIAEPWALKLTTMFEPGRMSVAEKDYERWVKLCDAGVVDKSFLFDHREAPKIRDWDDDAEIHAALVAGYGEAASWFDIQGLVEARHKMKRYEFARYFLNQVWGDADLGLVDLEEWDANAVACRPIELVPAESRVCLGLDGSRSHDQAVIGWSTTPDDDGVVDLDVLAVDVRRDRLPDPMWPHILHNGRIDYDDLGDTITERFTTLNVLEACYGTDYVGEATRYIDRRLPEAKVAQVARSSKLERAAIGALDQVLSSGKYRHRGDPVLRRALANTLVVRDPDTKTIIRIRPRKESEPIHAVYTLAFAVWRATRPKVGNPYQDRDLRVTGDDDFGRPVTDDDLEAAREVYAARIYMDDDDLDGDDG